MSSFLCKMEVQSDCNNVPALVLYALIFDCCFMSGYNNSNFQICFYRSYHYQWCSWRQRIKEGCMEISCRFFLVSYLVGSLILGFHWILQEPRNSQRKWDFTSKRWEEKSRVWKWRESWWASWRTIYCK